MTKSLLIIFSFLYLSEIFSTYLGIQFPANVIGMMVLAFLLQKNFIKQDSVKPGANLFLENLGLFFVPTGVGLINFLDLLNQNLIPIAVATFVSTFVVIAVVGLFSKFLVKQ